jgi:hypothetical protein
MSAYGFGPFENDDALEFLDEVEDAAVADRPVLLRAALDQVLYADGSVETAQLAEAIAAATVVVGVLRPDEAQRDLELPEWITSEPLVVDAPLAEAARRVVARVLAIEDDQLWHQGAVTERVPTLRMLGGGDDAAPAERPAGPTTRHPAPGVPGNRWQVRRAAGGL